MSIAECTVAGFPARLFRISFTGELGFEVNVPARHGRALWEKLWKAGGRYDVCAYGTETMHVLRAEKDFIVVGQDTDGTVMPNDAGLDWAVDKKKPNFVGMRSLARPDLTAKGRKQRRPFDRGRGDRAARGRPDRRRPEAAQADEDDRPRHLVLLERGLGTLDRDGGVGGGHERMDETLYVPMADETLAAKVVPSVF